MVLHRLLSSRKLYLVGTLFGTCFHFLNRFCKRIELKMFKKFQKKRTYRFWTHAIFVFKNLTCMYVCHYFFLKV